MASTSSSLTAATRNTGPGSRMPSARGGKVYQIDFTAVECGKRIASSKRRIRWRFGFANPEALAAGLKGTACRGEEHDVTLVWSIGSGKQLVLADGQEVHYSVSKSGVFDHSWTMRGGHVLKVLAHANPPLSQTPGWRQYDFFINGQSFFSFPKVYRLGLSPGDPRGAVAPEEGFRLAESGPRGTLANKRSDLSQIEAPMNPDEEEAYLQEAIRQSLEDEPKKTGPAPEADLLDFGGPPAPAVLPQSQAVTASSDPFHGYYSLPASLPPSQSVSSDPFAAPYGGVVAPTSAAPLALVPSTAPATGGYASSYGLNVTGSAAPGGYAAASYGGVNVAGSSSGYGGSYGSSNGLAAAPSKSFGGPGDGMYGDLGASAVAAPPASTPWGAPVAAPTPFAAGPAAYMPTPGVPTVLSTPQTVPPTPSTIGFASPPTNYYSGYAQPTAAPDAAQGYGFQSQPAATAASSFDSHGAPDATAPQFTMNTLHTEESAPNAPGATSGSLVDQAYAKLFNMDSFAVTSKDDAGSNPFASTGGSSFLSNQSLGDIQKSKPTATGAKEIMRTPMPAPGAMVVSTQQNGNWGGAYGATSMQQPGIQYSTPYGQPGPQAGYGQVPSSQPYYGQATYDQTQAPQPYGQGYSNTQVQPQYGQAPYSNPQVQPQYGQGMSPAFGQAPQQPPYGTGFVVPM